jgi:parvulin-like peptidyl-prolyl isomerase
MSERVARICGVVLAIFGMGIFSAQLRSQTPPEQKEVPLQIIVVRSPEEAQQVLEQLKKGTSFDHVAQEKSIDPTAQSGGFMGN